MSIPIVPNKSYCYYFLFDQCKTGPTCKYSHDGFMYEYIHNIKKYPKNICVHYLLDKCRYGVSCNNVHDNVICNEIKKNLTSYIKYSLKIDCCNFETTFNNNIQHGLEKVYIDFDYKAPQCYHFLFGKCIGKCEYQHNGYLYEYFNNIKQYTDYNLCIHYLITDGKCRNGVSCSKRHNNLFLKEIDKIIHDDFLCIITIDNLNSIFDFPISVTSWGRNFISSSNPTKYRYVGLFNQTSCRLDYDDDTRILTFTNATPTNLGCPATNNLPSGETLVAKIFLTYKV